MKTRTLVMLFMATIIGFMHFSCTTKQDSAGTIKTLTSDNFAEVTQSGVALVDFYADWCMPCKAMKPVMNKVAYLSGSKATICRLNVDNEPVIATQFNVHVLPTLVILKNGKPVDRITGIQSTDNIMNLLSKYIEK